MTREGLTQEPATPPPFALGREAGVGLGWSVLNNAVSRAGSFLAGIVVIRLIAQEDYGTFAVGLVVLTVLLSMNELGVSVAIVQHRGDVREIAPTVMTLSIVSSAMLAGLGYVVAPRVSELMQAPDAAGLIRLLLVAVLLDGVASVPNALLSRLFLQRRRLQIDLLAFLVGTPVTIGLALAGYGAWSLGVGAVAANAVTAALALWWSPLRVRPGWTVSVVAPLLRFGLPLAGASLLALLMLNIDYIVVGNRLGAVALGLYLLAFNLCAWPITVVTSAIRRVAVALFARLSEHAEDGGAHGFGQFLTVVLAVTLPMCLLLAAFASPLIDVLYGRRWVPAAVALPPLALLSFTRVAVEVTYDFMAGSGRTRSTVWLHAVWLSALGPALWVGAEIGGIQGVALGHAFVSVAVVAPTLVILLRRAGITWAAHSRSVMRLLSGAVTMGAVILIAHAAVESPVASMMIGTPLSLLVYVAIVWPMHRDALSLWNLRTDIPPVVAT